MMLKHALVALALIAAPAAAQTALPETPDARLAVAREIAARTLPPGAMKTMVGGIMNAIPAQMVDQMMDQRIADYAGLAGGQAAEIRKRLGGTTIRQMMDILDPAFAERQRLTMKAMADGMGELMGQMEPQLREVAAQSMAERLSPAELVAARAFYTSPDGAAVAAKMMAMTADPAYLQRAQAINAEMFKQMPNLIAAAAKATAGLPPPRTVASLTAAEKAKLSALLGVTK